MAEHDSASQVDPFQVVRIVGSYVQHHQITPDQLAEVIGTVQRALGRLGNDVPPVQEPPKPAVPIRRSVQPDYVVCLECGFRSKTLRRHLRMRHGLEAAEYRVRWKLPPDHTLVAPAYSAQRSAAAKEIGLGRNPAQDETG
ncbi:MAG: MucR family transcriptional regulator [Acidobacteria bacterium]|nr:MucR family transcriptional regulator [Acidobacteriota bacterium]